ncbi:hypothetical protein YC2023_059612 [Brassica napus]
MNFNYYCLITKNLFDKSCSAQQNVLTFGGCQGWRDIKGTMGQYRPISVGVCINGFIYYGAYNSTDRWTIVLMTVSVYTQISIWGWIEYNGKLASIVREPYDSKVSIYGCVFPPLRDILFRATKYPGTNKAGEIIMVPHTCCHTRSNHSTFSTTMSEQTTSGKVCS